MHLLITSVICGALSILFMTYKNPRTTGGSWVLWTFLENIHRLVLWLKCASPISCLKDKSLCYLSDKLFMPFELNDKGHGSALCDTDPDLHFYQEFNQVTVKCNYYLETIMGYHKIIINKNQKPQTQSRFKIGDNLITSDKNMIL